MSAADMRHHSSHKMDRSTHLVAWLYGTLLIISIVGSKFQSDLRWALYLLPLITLLYVVFASRGKLRLRLEAVYACALISAAYLLSILASGEMGYGARWFLFVAATPIMFLLQYEIDSKFIKILSVSLAAGTLLNVTFALLSGQPLFADTDVFGSDSANAESELAFPAAACTVYFVCMRQWRWAIFTTAIALASWKRGAVVATMAALLIHYALMLIGSTNWRLRTSTLLICIVFVIGLIAGRFTNDIFEYVGDQFFVNDSINALTMGRFYTNELLVHAWTAGDFFNKAFGHGPGFSEALMTQQTLLRNPHNDFMLILLEIGLFGFVMHVAAWVYLNGGTAISAPLAAFTVVLYLVDNTYVYFFHTFVVTALIIAFPRKERTWDARSNPTLVPRPRYSAIMRLVHR